MGDDLVFWRVRPAAAAAAPALGPEPQWASVPRGLVEGLSFPVKVEELPAEAELQGPPALTQPAQQLFGCAASGPLPPEPLLDLPNPFVVTRDLEQLVEGEDDLGPQLGLLPQTGARQHRVNRVAASILQRLSENVLACAAEPVQCPPAPPSRIAAKKKEVEGLEKDVQEAQAALDEGMSELKMRTLAWKQQALELARKELGETKDDPAPPKPEQVEVPGSPLAFVVKLTPGGQSCYTCREFIDQLASGENDGKGTGHSTCRKHAVSSSWALRLAELDASPATFTGGPEEKAKVYTHQACWVPFSTFIKACPCFPVPQHEFQVSSSGPQFGFAVRFASRFDGHGPSWAPAPTFVLPWNQPTLEHHMTGEEVLRGLDLLSCLLAADALDVLGVWKDRGLGQDVVGALQLAEGDLRVYPLPRTASRLALEKGLAQLEQTLRLPTEQQTELSYYRRDLAEACAVGLRAVVALPDDHAPTAEMLPRMRSSLLGEHLLVHEQITKGLDKFERSLA